MRAALIITVAAIAISASAVALPATPAAKGARAWVAIDMSQKRYRRRRQVPPAPVPSPALRPQPDRAEADVAPYEANVLIAPPRVEIVRTIVNPDTFVDRWAALAGP